jgi:hypothetical protein
MTSFTHHIGPNPLTLSWSRPDVTTFLDQTTLRAHLAIDGSALDALLVVYEQAAIDWAEDYMKRSIMAREHLWVLSDFPRLHYRSYGRAPMQLPRGKTIRINSIDYFNAGVERHLYGPSTSGSPPSEDYQENLSSESGGFIMPARGRDWPSVDCDVISPVTVNFRAGWETADEVPAAIKHAVMFAIDDMLESRGTQDLAALGAIAANGKTSQFRESLLGYYRLIKVY